MSRGTSPADREIHRLGLAAAALMHDLLGTLQLVEERTAFVAEEVASGRTPASAAQAAATGAAELSALVGDVLATVSGRTDRVAPFDPVEAACREAARVARAAAPLELRCEAALPPGLRIAGRESLFARAVRNLVENATRYATSRVNVSLEPRPDGDREGVLVAVEDDGAGLPEELREGIFEPGVRGERSSGWGIGLASVRWAAEALGGTVRAGGGSAMGGARFELWLPVVGTAPAPPRGAKPLSGRTVVVIDDDAAVSRLFARALVRAGADARELSIPAGEVDAAIEQLCALEPALVLLDLNLGAVDGERLWYLIRSRCEPLARRVVLISGAFGWGEATPSGGPHRLGKGMPLPELMTEVAACIERADRTSHG